MFDPWANFETATLSNGLTVHALYWPNHAGERFGFAIHSGARHDLPGKEGSAHYMEHLVNCNGGSSFEELKAFFEGNSGDTPYLGGTSFFYTKYGFHSSADSELLTESLRLFGSMLLHARLEKHMEREREIIIKEFNRRYPAQYKYDLVRRMQTSVFPNTFFARMPCPLGTLETIAAMTEGDLQQFYDSHYTPANMSVVAVGELSLDQVIRYLEESPFGLEKKGHRSEKVMSIESPPLPTETLELFPLSEYQKGVTAAQYQSIAQLPGSISIEKMGVFYRMLKQRLFEVVRQKHAWAYHVGCAHEGYGGDFRLFEIHCDDLNLEVIDTIESVVTAIIQELSHSTELFQKARQSGIIYMKFLDPNGQGILDSAVKDLLDYNRIRSLSEEIAEIESVSLEDIAYISDLLSRERRCTCIQYP